MQTSKAVLKLSDYFAASGMTPMEAYKQIKWAFKALDKAPHKLKAIKTIYLPELALTIDVQSMSAKKVIKLLSKSEYTYYKITDMNDNYHETSVSRTRSSGSISKSIIDLVYLFTHD